MTNPTREEVIKYFTDALSLLVAWERDGDAFLVKEPGQIELWNRYFDKTYSATEDHTPLRNQYLDDLADLIRSLPEPNAPTVAIEGVEYVRRDVVLDAMAALCERSDIAESSVLKVEKYRDKALRHILDAAIKEAEK